MKTIWENIRKNDNKVYIVPIPLDDIDLMKYFSNNT